jgi:hypothetical protein
MSVLISLRHGMSGTFGSLQSHRQRRAVAQKVPPPVLGVGHVGGDFELVAAAAVATGVLNVRPDRRPV